MKYRELFSQGDLSKEIEGGYVRLTHHPELPLKILNYSERAQYEQRWNNVTRNCRGLIIDHNDNVIARPWPKFHNLGEHDGVRHAEVDLDAKCVTQEKLDGSMGCAYMTPDGPAIATRGSFTSDQAVWATAWLRENMPGWRMYPHVTYLFEIIFEQNRIVVDYDFEGLVMLSCHATDSYARRVDMEWQGRKADILPPRTVREALAMPDRANVEGVVCTIGTGTNRVMVKLKQPDYVEKHRVVTGLSEKIIWEALSTDTGVTEIVESIPDEYHKWVEATAEKFQEQFVGIVVEAAKDWADRPQGVDRAGFAEFAKTCKYPAMMFRMFDGKPWGGLVWNLLKPKGDSRMVNNG